MDPRRYERIAELFHAASEMTPEEAKEFLDRTCAGDDDLRREVDSLLAHDPETSFSRDETSPSGPIRSALVSMDSEGRVHGATSWVFGQQEPEAVGKKFGDFEIVREVGRGGMGVVFEARQISVNRRVALKVLPPVLGVSPGSTIRFEREARAAARLKHPNIVSAHATGEAEGYHYYAMEFIDGVPLNRILDDLGAEKEGLENREAEGAELIKHWKELLSGKERFAEVARLVAEVAEALNYAHGQGVIHRDIKPGNLLCSKEGRLMISDFGLARIAGDPGLTQTGTFQGSVGYMSPEQIAAGRMPLDHRTDIYSLGTVLYEMLTLAPPFDGTSREEVVGAVLTTDPAPPRKLDHRIPRDLETICLHALEKNPGRRYATAGQMAEDLRKFLARVRITARRPGGLRRAEGWVKKHALVACLAVAAMIAAGVGANAIHARRERDQRAAEEKASQERKEYFSRRVALLHLQQEIEGGETIHYSGSDNITEPPEGDLVFARSLLKEYGSQLLPDPINVGLQNQLTNAARNNPHGWAAQFVFAEVLRRQNPPRTQEADREEAEAKQKMPSTAEAWYIRSFTTPALALALDYAEKALQGNPGEEVLRLARERVVGLCLFLRKFPKALEVARELADGEKEDPRLRQLLGCVLALNGRYLEAITEFSRAIELSPVSSNLYQCRAGAYLCLRNWEKSIADYTRLIESEPNTGISWIFHHRTTPQWLGGHFEQADEDFKKMVDVVGGYIARGRRYIFLEDWAEDLKRKGQTALAREKHREAQAYRAEVLGAPLDLSPLDQWKGKILQLLAGKMTPEDLIREADRGDPERLCEAYYYAGEYSHLKGDFAAAEKWFKKSVATGTIFQKRFWLRRGFDVMNEWHLARWRLDQMKK